MTRVKIIIFLMLFGVGTIGFSQDIHFSQFNNSPINLNPGLMGQFDGDYRFVGNQRTQWRSVTTPYSTFGVSADANGIFNTDNIGAAVSLYNDVAGDSEFGTLQLGIGGSYKIFIKDSSQSVNIGLQPTFTQRSINYDQLTFDNQYNGSSYDPNLGNGEEFQNNGRTYLNIHTGLSWNRVFEQRKSVTAGLALHNINSPKQTFFSDNSIQLKQRLSLHANGLIQVSDKIDALPSVLVMMQHKYREIIFGGSGKYHLNHPDYTALYAGIWYRNKDAAYLSAGLDWTDFHFGISYDFNMSSLRPASHNKGGFEFAVIYILRRFKPEIKRYITCPNYI